MNGSYRTDTNQGDTAESLAGGAADTGRRWLGRPAIAGGVTVLIAAAAVAWFVVKERSDGAPRSAGRTTGGPPTPAATMLSPSRSGGPSPEGSGSSAFDPFSGADAFPNIWADAYLDGIRNRWNLVVIRGQDKGQPNQKVGSRREDSGKQGYSIEVKADAANRLRIVDCGVGAQRSGGRATERAATFLRECVSDAVTGLEGTQALAWIDARFADNSLDILNVDQEKRLVEERFGWARITLSIGGNLALPELGHFSAHLGQARVIASRASRRSAGSGSAAVTV